MSNSSEGVTAPHDDERVARQALLDSFSGEHETPEDRAKVDAYRAAVYASAMRDAVGVVESCEVTANTRYTGEKYGVGVINKAILLESLAALPATPSREGAHGT